MKIIWVAGARPNFVKIAPIWRAMLDHNAAVKPNGPRFEPLLVHTGQHYDANMSGVFFRDLALPEPDFFLGVGGGSHGDQVARILVAFEKLLEQERPAMVGVVGDVNSTCACALATAKSYILPGSRTPLLIHVEAGLRSGDRLMPEEINRLVTDAIADLLFTSESSGTENLIREGVPESKIHFVGNVMVDSLLAAVKQGPQSGLLTRLGLGRAGGHRPQFALATLHRPSNVENVTMLRRIMGAFETIGSRIPVVFPLHPRTRARLDELGLLGEKVENGTSGGFAALHPLPPLGYDEFLAVLQRAKLVITDSGGIQEETTALGIPCLTLRENTERPVTVTLGTNLLLGRDTNRLVAEVERILDGVAKVGSIPPLWDGRAAKRIAAVLMDFIRCEE